jgi:hypothetical protein
MSMRPSRQATVSDDTAPSTPWASAAAGSSAAASPASWAARISTVTSRR